MSAITSRRAARPVRRPAPALLAAGAVAAAGLAITGAGVFAALNATATNTTAQAATSGVLSLQMSPNGAGFTQAVSNLAPGDTVNRYVTLTQGADLDGKALTLAVTDATPTLLTTSATKGLKVTVTQCSVAWTVSSGTCGSGGTSTVLGTAGTALSAIPTATPEQLVAGAVAAGSTLNLQISLALPDQTETTVNGSAPTGTIQGLASALTWTFSETQRTATTTGS
ncbi:TasA family protein [Pseudarthrobacter phenanthrenivorans]|uniref:TasA family protein n=1 Tax=Pseudarthrobacter phenanthrenivorans TaxID=361575 RepID=UPI002F3547AF